MTIQRHEFATRLETLLTDFRFAAGRDARRSDGVVDVWVQCERTNEGREQHVVSIFSGFTLGEAHGLQPAGFCGVPPPTRDSIVRFNVAVQF